MKKWQLSIICIIFHNILYCQSIHFTQFNSVPSLFNPAFTGYTNNCIRYGIIRREQLMFLDNHYKSNAAFIDFIIPKNKDKTKRKLRNQTWGGAGMTISTDNSGVGNLKSTVAQLSGALHIGLFNSHVDFSLGPAIGVINNRSVNYNPLLFNNQWDGYEFNSSINNNENYLSPHFSYFKWITSLGCLLNITGERKNYTENLKNRFYIGYSRSFLLNPIETFYNCNNFLGPRDQFTLGYIQEVSSNIVISGKSIISFQKSSTEKIFEFDLNKTNGIFPFQIGFLYQLEKEFSLSLGYYKPNIENIKDNNYKNIFVSFEKFIFNFERNVNLRNWSYEVSMTWKLDYFNDECKCEHHRYQTDKDIYIFWGYQPRNYNFKICPLPTCEKAIHLIPELYYSHPFIKNDISINNTSFDILYRFSASLTALLNCECNSDPVCQKFGIGGGFENYNRINLFPVFFRTKLFIRKSDPLYPQFDIGYSFANSKNNDGINGGILCRFGIGVRSFQLNKNNVYGNSVDLCTALRLQEFNIKSTTLNANIQKKEHLLFLELKLSVKIGIIIDWW